MTRWDRLITSGMTDPIFGVGIGIGIGVDMD